MRLDRDLHGLLMYADDMVICTEMVEGKSIEVEVCLGKEGNEGQPQ